MSKVIRHKTGNPLHDLLLRACPPHRETENGYVPDPDGIRSISVLAYTLGMSRWGVHKWVKNNRVPPQKVKVMVENNPEAVSLQDFSPYVFG